jgi:hypothetical protein
MLQPATPFSSLTLPRLQEIHLVFCLRFPKQTKRQAWDDWRTKQDSGESPRNNVHHTTPNVTHETTTFTTSRNASGGTTTAQSSPGNNTYAQLLPSGSLESVQSQFGRCRQHGGTIYQHGKQVKTAPQTPKQIPSLQTFIPVDIRKHRRNGAVAGKNYKKITKELQKKKKKKEEKKQHAATNCHKGHRVR